MLEVQPVAESLVAGATSAPLALWRLAYPMAYSAEVQSAANEFGVDPLLVLAVMREESRYKPLAISRSNAQGLMQLMPNTRDWIASKLGVSVGAVSAFDPKTNIRFGTWYLSYLLRYFDNDVELALAGYNGGPGNVDKWQKLPLVKERSDLLRFIPYYETREYIQRVMSSYFVYQQLARLDGGSVKSG
jgi:soluble lytic murein transglycosylase